MYSALLCSNLEFIRIMSGGCQVESWLGMIIIIWLTVTACIYHEQKYLYRDLFLKYSRIFRRKKFGVQTFENPKRMYSLVKQVDAADTNWTQMNIFGICLWIHVSKLVNFPFLVASLFNDCCWIPRVIVDNELNWKIGVNGFKPQRSNNDRKIYEPIHPPQQWVKSNLNSFSTGMGLSLENAQRETKLNYARLAEATEYTDCFS